MMCIIIFNVLGTIIKFMETYSTFEGTLAEVRSVSRLFDCRVRVQMS